jgi:hypothetical protein
MSSRPQVAQVLGYGSDPETGAPVCRVRYTDGSTATQYGKVSDGLTSASAQFTSKETESDSDP